MAVQGTVQSLLTVTKVVCRATHILPNVPSCIAVLQDSPNAILRIVALDYDPRVESQESQS